MPDWYKEGYISYMSRDWDAEIDNMVRDGILSGRYKKLNNLTGDDAVVAGHSFWNFIARQYSPSAITNIILMTSASNNLKKGFLYVLGLSYEILIKEWYSYYEQQYQPFINTTSKPDGLLPIRYKNDVVYGGFKDVSELPDLVIERLKHYFLTYKDMPGLTHESEITHVYNAEEAHQVIMLAISDYKNRFENLRSALQNY